MSYKYINFKSLIPYLEGLKLQAIAFDKVLNQEAKGILLILEHEAVYTIGKDGGWNNLLESKDVLNEEGIDVVEVNRGGNITFHGPGQIVLYPILDLNYLGKDIHLFIDNLEKSIIETLKNFDIEATQKPKYRGVWVDDQKIAAVGVHISKWISSHGIAFNINVDKRNFDRITPCGLKDFRVVSLDEYKGRQSIENIKELLIQSFESIFKLKFEETSEDYLSEENR